MLILPEIVIASVVSIVRFSLMNALKEGPSGPPISVAESISE